MLDLLIKNGLVFDGLGASPVRADVGVRGGRIVALAPHIDEPAATMVDAAGLWVTPGFIDIHTHYDLELEVSPGLGESVRHGVTSVVIGNCSLSIAVGEPHVLAEMFQRVETLSRVLLHKWLQSAVSWRTPREYLSHLDQLKLGPNVAALLGHSALRAQVMGLARSLKERATDDELKAMRRIAEDALDVGFIGISVDMLPWHMMSGELRGRAIPSHHADFREYAMLADVCRRRDAVFQVTPNPQRPASLADIIRLSVGVVRRPLRATVLAALDSVHERRLWRVFRPLLFTLNTLLGCNIRFQTLTEPFTVFSDGPLTPLFEEFACGVKLNDCEAREERRRLWQAPDFRNQFRREWLRGRHRTFHRDLAQMRIVRCPDESLIGLSVAEAARRAGAEPVEFWMDALEKFDADLRWAATGANDREGPRRALMRDPHILPGFTDAGAHVRNLGYYDGALSLLKQAVTPNFMSPERAIARVTGEPARWFRLDAGVLKIGAQADLLLLNPAHLNAPLSEQSEFQDPLLDGEMRMVKRGSEKIIEAVYINGEAVVARGELLPCLGREKLGSVLRPADVRSPAEKRRDRINDEIAAHPFTDYWDVFLLKHQHPANIALHALGVVIFYGLLALAWARGNAWLLALLPTSQLVGLVGHYFFERSHIDFQDAVFSVRASRCLNRMFFKLVTGTYGAEVRRAKEELLRLQAAQPDTLSTR